MLYERLLRPWLFGRDAEAAHDSVTRMLAAAQSAPGGAAMMRAMAGTPPSMPVKAFGLAFPNPLGLAAGFDKNAALTRVLPSLGFGFVEVGSITLRPQPGNPKPRLFRLVEHEAVINRMGFNNVGAEAAARLLERRGPGIVGINLGLNKDCPKDRAAQEYAECFRILRPYGDYFVVNVSSPNTSGLRDLQEKRHLETILEKIRADKPLLVKLAPDLTDSQLDDVLEVCGRLADGVIATNTTIQRPGIPADVHELQGGLSGKPLRALSTEMIRKIRSRSALPIIGVGGVFTGGDALEKLEAGATLVQIYTSLIYRGPSAATRILSELAELRK